MVINQGLDARRIARFAMLGVLFASGCLSLSALGGCGDEATPLGDSERHNATAASHDVDWLELSSAVTPAQWIVSRGEAKIAPINDPHVQRVGQQLAEAHKRYRESERMIANRSVQLSDMLQQIGIAEKPSQILDDLVNIGAEVGQTEGFGAISQYYFNLRSASTTRADALSTLKARYGSKS